MDLKIRDLIQVSPEEIFDLPEAPDESCDYCGDPGPLEPFEIEGTTMHICSICKKNTDMDVSMFNVNVRNWEIYRKGM